MSNAAMTVAAKKNHVEVSGLSLDEAREMFGDKASEEWGTVRVEGVSVAKVRAALRDAGHRTQVAK